MTVAGGFCMPRSIIGMESDGVNLYCYIFFSLYLILKSFPRQRASCPASSSANVNNGFTFIIKGSYVEVQQVALSGFSDNWFWPLEKWRHLYISQLEEKLHLRPNHLLIITNHSLKDILSWPSLCLLVKYSSIQVKDYKKRKVKKCSGQIRDEESIMLSSFYMSLKNIKASDDF